MAILTIMKISWAMLFWQYGYRDMELKPRGEKSLNEWKQTTLKIEESVR